MTPANQSTDRKPLFSMQSLSNRFFLVILCSFGLILASCSDNSTGTNGGGDTNGGNGGDTNGGNEIGTDPTFSNVQQIFEQSCAGSSCHINTTTNGVRLDTYDNVMNSQGAQYGQLVVQPGDPDGSPLVDKIEPNPEFGVRMPQTGTSLPQERIDQIRTWIEEGAENN